VALGESYVDNSQIPEFAEMLIFSRKILALRARSLPETC
jgi:hypothetical protein